MPPTFIQHDGSICNLKRFTKKKEYKSALIVHAKSTIPNVGKWLPNTNIHQQWPNLFGMLFGLQMRKSCKPSNVDSEDT
jgi:hypothetical protein